MSAGKSADSASPWQRRSLSSAPHYLRILVYNVSHSDIIYGYRVNKGSQSGSAGVDVGNAMAATEDGLGGSDGAQASTIFIKDNVAQELCRATFSKFFPISNQVLTHVRKRTTKISIVMGMRADGEGASPVGFKLNPPLHTTFHPTAFRFRNLANFNYGTREGDNSASKESNTTTGSSIIIETVYFPLIAIVAPAWFPHDYTYSQSPGMSSVSPSLKGASVPEIPLLSDLSHKLQLLLYLVSGNGMPRNRNHNPLDNSTSAASLLIAEFVRQAYVEGTKIDTTIVNSNGDLFRCHHNVSFVNKQLRPLIDAHRTQLAKRFGESWKRRMHVTLALTDGAPARVQALQACLRNYRPVFLHVWQLKSFWHDRTLTVEDLDIQTFEDMETRPPVDRNKLPLWQQRLVDEMAAFKREFDLTRQDQNHELHAFWLRKTKKPVLSIVMVEVEDDKRVPQPKDSTSTTDDDTEASHTSLRFFRGINCEVSMPTGSLCSERNAIGTALATNVGIRREQFKAVAIMSTSVVSKPGTYEANSPRRVPSTVASQVPPTDQDVSIKSRKRPRMNPEEGLDAWRLKRWRSNSTDSTETTRSIEQSTEVVIKSYQVRSGTPHSPSSRRAMMGPNIQIKTDLNPIAPCGACLEWLKKIAEVNPDFRVLMFEDTSCTKVFVRSVFGVETAGQ